MNSEIDSLISRNWVSWLGRSVPIWRKFLQSYKPWNCFGIGL